MKSKIRRVSALALLVVIVCINTMHAQPPPPPPPGDDPPCWPPPCIPVDNGIIVAIGIAVAFGAFFLYRSMKLRSAGKQA
jgi:hypothetical protein